MSRKTLYLLEWRCCTKIFISIVWLGNNMSKKTCFSVNLLGYLQRTFSLLIYNLQFKNQRGVITVKKLELLARIQKLASLVHSEDLVQLNLTAESITELKCKLDELTEEYIACYC